MALSPIPVGKLIARSSQVVYGSGVSVDTLLHTCTQDCRLNVLATPQKDFGTNDDGDIFVVRPDDPITTIMLQWNTWYDITSYGLPQNQMYVGRTWAWAESASPTARPKSVSTATTGPWLNSFINGPLLAKGTKIYQRTAGSVATTEHCLFVVLEMQPEVMTYDQL